MEVKVTKYNKVETINDYIYDLISIPAFFCPFINSLELQRLRNIKQEPASCYVFPSVTNTCYDHSIGTFYLSNYFIKELKEKQKDLDINQTLINSISLCGLFCNIGRTPFFNSFKSFYKEKYNLDYNEKEKAFELLERICQLKNIDLDCTTNKNDEENFNKDIIKNILINSNKNELKFYQQIVSNPITGIDCENFDLMKRNIYKYGFHPLFDENVLIKTAIVKDDKICFRKEDAFSISDFYNARYTMNKKFYLHRVVSAIEIMIKDIFHSIDCVYKFNDLINDNNKFIYFFDSFLGEVKRSNNPLLNEAKNIINNIEKRNLYFNIGDYYSSIKENDSKKNFEEFDSSTLLNYLNINKKNIVEKSEIRIKKEIINLGQSNHDPLEDISFFDDNLNISRINKNEVSKLLPDHFQERIIRVFITNKDKQKIEALQEAIINYKNRYQGNVNLNKTEKKLEVGYNNIFDKLYGRK